MKNDYVIYGLVDPFTLDLRYIGQSIKGLQRARDHFTPSAIAKRENPHNSAWIKKIISKGIKPETIVLERFESAEKLDEAEKDWIAQSRRLGCNLNNLTEGGNKPPITVMSLEERRKRSEKMMGHPGYWKGKKFSEEHKELISQNGIRVTSFCDENGNLYNTAKEAASVFGCSVRSIYSNLKGIQKTVKGHKLTYVSKGQ